MLAVAVGAVLLALSLASAGSPATASAASTSNHYVSWRRSVHRLAGKWGGFTAVSCAAVNMCVATDASGHVVWSKAPWAIHAKYWKMARVDKDRGGLTGISCPTKSFCAAVDGSGHVLWSTAPTGGLKKWSGPVRIDPTQAPGGGYVGLAGISCASPQLCVAVDNSPNGEVMVSTDPTGGARTWHRATIAPGQQLTSVSCASTSLCVVTGTETYYATRVYGYARDWHAAQGAPGGGVFSSVACAHSSSMCLAVGYNNTSTGFASGSARVTSGGWVYRSIESYPPGPTEGLVNGVACPTTSFCVALDTSESAYVSNSPLAGGWSAPKVIRPGSLSVTAELSCTLKLCVAVDNRGVITSGSVRG